MSRETRLRQVEAQLNGAADGMCACPRCGRLRCSKGRPRSRCGSWSAISARRSRSLRQPASIGPTRTHAHAQTAAPRCALCGLPPDLDEPPAHMTLPDLVRAAAALGR